MKAGDTVWVKDSILGGNVKAKVLEIDSKSKQVYLDVGGGVRSWYALSSVLRKVSGSKACDKHGKVGCESTMCPESPNFNALTQI
jgi:hypothetical protein